MIYYCRNCNSPVSEKNVIYSDSNCSTGLTHNVETCYGVIEIIKDTSFMVCLFCQLPKGHALNCPQLLNKDELETIDEIEELDSEDLIEVERLMNLQIYIAASQKDQEVARLLSVALLECHVQNVASWINERIIPEKSNTANADTCRYFANTQIDDLDKAQAMIFLVGDNEHISGKGAHQEFKTPGKSFESGYLIAQGKPIFFVGKPYSIFHYHKSVTFFDNTDDLISWFKQSMGGVTNAVRLAALL